MATRMTQVFATKDDLASWLMERAAERAEMTMRITTLSKRREIQAEVRGIEFAARMIRESEIR